MREFAKNTAIGMGWVAVSLVGLVVALVSWIGYMDYVASRKAQAFCQSINVGSDTKGIVERALASGSNPRTTNWRPWEDKRTLPVAFGGGAGTHICMIDAKNGRVVFRSYANND